MGKQDLKSQKKSYPHSGKSPRAWKGAGYSKIFFFSRCDPVGQNKEKGQKYLYKIG